MDVSLNEWVRPKGDIAVSNEIMIDCDTNGKIINVEDDGRIYVAFPDAHVHTTLKELKPPINITKEDGRELDSIEEIISFIEEFEGHRCGHGHFQFDIKLDVSLPDDVSNSPFNEEDKYTYLDDLVRIEYEHAVGIEADEGLVQVLHLKDAFRAGKSNGWLVVQTFIYPDWSTDEMTEHAEALEQDFKADNLEQAEYEEEMKEFESKLLELAYTLQYIEQSVLLAKDNVPRWVMSEEAWEGYWTMDSARNQYAIDHVWSKPGGKKGDAERNQKATT
jgi:hypothetical protein